jgi:hypothetical protein
MPEEKAIASPRSRLPMASSNDVVESVPKRA